MSPVWGAFLCALVVGASARAPSARAVDSMAKEIYIRDDSSNTHDYNLTFGLVNQLLDSFTEGGETLKITCLNCQTVGTAQVSTTGINKNDTFFRDIATLVKIDQEDGLSAAVADAIDVNIIVDFQNTSAILELDVNFDASASHTFNILALPVIALSSPIDGANDNIGVVLTLDLTLSANAAADFTAGFEVSLGDSATITIDPVEGKILSFDFAGLKFNALPATIVDPNLEFSAVLRATLEVGTTVSVDLIFEKQNVSFEAGVFVDLVNYQANVTTVAGNFTLGGGSSLGNSSVLTPPYANGTSAVGNSSLSAPPYRINGTYTAGNGTVDISNGTLISLNTTVTSTSWNSTIATGKGTGTITSWNATSVASNSSGCGLGALFQEELSIDIGAFATATANISFIPSGLNFNEAATTTLFSLTLPTICL